MIWTYKWVFSKSTSTCPRFCRCNHRIDQGIDISQWLTHKVQEWGILAYTRFEMSNLAKLICLGSIGIPYLYWHSCYSLYVWYGSAISNCTEGILSQIHWHIGIELRSSITLLYRSDIVFNKGGDRNRAKYPYLQSPSKIIWGIMHVQMLNIIQLICM